MIVSQIRKRSNNRTGNDAMLNAEKAKQKLIEGNKKFLTAVTGSGNISPQIRRDTVVNGQHPYAIVITCSDSRVIPEYIFSAGIGELFVIRIVGNVLDNHQLGSIEYAVEHLGAKLIVMLGHTRCGAIEATIASESSEGFVDYLLQDIAKAIGDEKDDYTASCLNVRSGVERLRKELKIGLNGDDRGIEVVGAIYHIEEGNVEFLTD